MIQGGSQGPCQIIKCVAFRPGVAGLALPGRTGLWVPQSDPDAKGEKNMAETEKHEHARTQGALDTLTKWGRDPGTDGGENIVFSVSRQGAPSDAFMATGDCTGFTPAGSRGVLSGQPPGSTGEPVAYFIDFSGSPGSPLTVNQVPFTFSFDLNAGKVTLAGSFPNLAPSLDFTVEFAKEFDGAGGENFLFYSERTSDHSGYVIAVELVAAS
jgi:hypothetical protein